MTVRVEYHHEDDAWWADSPDLPGWTAGGDTLAKARELVRSGLVFFLEDEDVDVLESAADQPVIVVTYQRNESLTLFGSATAGATAAARIIHGFHGEAASLPTTHMNDQVPA